MKKRKSKARAVDGQVPTGLLAQIRALPEARQAPALLELGMRVLGIAWCWALGRYAVRGATAEEAFETYRQRAVLPVRAELDRMREAVDATCAQGRAGRFEAGSLLARSALDALVRIVKDLDVAPPILAWQRMMQVTERELRALATEVANELDSARARISRVNGERVATVPIDADGTPWVSVKDAAKMLGITRTSLVRRKDQFAWVTVGRSNYFSVNSLRPEVVAGDRIRRRCLDEILEAKESERQQKELRGEAKQTRRLPVSI